MTDLATALRQLADKVDDLETARVVGELEALKYVVWTNGTTAAPSAPSPATPTPSRALDIEAVMARTGMSKPWLYRQARKGALPFARRLGRRLVFDEAGLTRWLERRPR